MALTTGKVKAASQNGFALKVWSLTGYIIEIILMPRDSYYVVV